MVSRLLGIFRRRDPDLDHEGVQDLASDFIDDELDAEARRKVVAHLDRCVICTRFMNTLRATLGLLRSTPKELPPSDLKEQLRESIRKERTG